MPSFFNVIPNGPDSTKVTILSKIKYLRSWDTLFHISRSWDTLFHTSRSWDTLFHISRSWDTLFHISLVNQIPLLGCCNCNSYFFMSTLMSQSM